MFVYEKKLQYPVKIKNANPRLAALIISQYGGPDGELGASLRYLSQRYSMPYPELKGLLTDIGTEELGHLEMIGTIVHQLTCNLSEKDIKTAEQKARVTYDNILRLSDDPDVNDVIKFLRAREIVHFQRFGEGLRLAKDRMSEKNIYFINPSFDS